MKIILQVSGLNIWDSRNEETIVKNVSFSLKENSCLALVGESGSGKSMTCKAIMGLTRPWIRCSGRVEFNGYELLTLPKQQLRRLCGSRLCMILQDGMSAFDPSCVIGQHFRETLMEHFGWTVQQADERMVESMLTVRLKNPIELLKKYPHQLSGGMLQRAMIALALVLEPEIIIADEPTTALDTITQFEVMEQFAALQKRTSSAIIFVSHDLGVVNRLADTVVVMKNGSVVEFGSLPEVFEQPQKEYTKYLVSSRQALGIRFRQVLGGNEPC
jgi:nickel transport system ATP-binding protein